MNDSDASGDPSGDKVIESPSTLEEHMKKQEEYARKRKSYTDLWRREIPSEESPC
jgi:hypothetical protein